MSTEALRGTSWHQFFGRRNELSAQLEMDRGKVQDGFGRRLRHQTRCNPSGSDLYRRSYRLGSVNRCGAGRSRTAAVLSRLIEESSSPAASPGVSGSSLRESIRRGAGYLPRRSPLTPGLHPRKPVGLTMLETAATSRGHNPLIKAVAVAVLTLCPAASAQHANTGNDLTAGCRAAHNLA
jgi:hypothetical protein